MNGNVRVIFDREPKIFSSIRDSGTGSSTSRDLAENDYKKNYT